MKPEKSNDSILHNISKRHHSEVFSSEHAITKFINLHTLRHIKNGNTKHCDIRKKISTIETLA